MRILPMIAVIIPINDDQSPVVLPLLPPKDRRVAKKLYGTGEGDVKAVSAA